MFNWRRYEEWVGRGKQQWSRQGERGGGATLNCILQPTQPTTQRRKKKKQEASTPWARVVCRRYLALVASHTPWTPEPSSDEVTMGPTFVAGQANRSPCSLFPGVHSCENLVPIASKMGKIGSVLTIFSSRPLSVHSGWRTSRRVGCGGGVDVSHHAWEYEKKKSLLRSLASDLWCMLSCLERGLAFGEAEPRCWGRRRGTTLQVVRLLAAKKSQLCSCSRAALRDDGWLDPNGLPAGGSEAANRTTKETWRESSG